MKVQRAPLMAASIIFFLVGTVPAAYTQLPPTNMGKWVHQPGDNQYGQQAQHDRHYVPQVAPAPTSSGGYSGGGGGGGGMSGWRPTPAPVKADISLDPIAADEPVAAVGFPPLPDRLDLPVQSSWGGGGRGGGGGSYGGASPPGMQHGGPPVSTGTHQHYAHYEPGAFAPPGSMGGGGGGGGGPSPGQAAQPQSHGYYKAREVAPPRNPASDYYNNNTAGGTGGAPGMAGPGGGGPSDSMRALKSLGKEPKMNKSDGSPETPDAPQPVVVNQASTQDLSLPEDDFAYQGAPGTGGNRYAKRLGRQVKRTIVRPINSAAGRFGLGIGF